MEASVNEYWGMNQELTEQITLLREALEVAKRDRVERCAEIGCMCDTMPTHCWSYYDKVLAATGITQAAE